MMSLSAKYLVGLPLGVMLATAAIGSIASAQSSGPISLFTPGTARTEPPPGEALRGVRPEAVGEVAYFTISPVASRSLRSPKPGPSQMRIELPGGKSVTCSLEATGTSLSGSIEGQDLSACDLVVSDGKVNGSIDSEAGRFRILPVGNGGTHAVVAVRSEAFPPEQEGPNLRPKLQGKPLPDKRSMRDEPTCDVMPANGKPKQLGPLRVLLLYTQGAVRDSANIKADVTLLINDFNRTLSLNKAYKARVVLAAALPVDYVEAGDMEVDLYRLSGNVPGFVADVPKLRDKYKADVVHLIIHGSGDSCGIGWLLDPTDPRSAYSGYSLSDRGCAVDNYSFIHEIGHNLGLNHDRAVVDSAGPDDFNFGFVDVPDGFRTVMAYNNACGAVQKNCRRLPVFSTPKLFYNGMVLGKPVSDGSSAYNAEIVCRTLPYAAKFAEIRAKGN